MGVPRHTKHRVEIIMAEAGIESTLSPKGKLNSDDSWSYSLCDKIDKIPFPTGAFYPPQKETYSITSPIKESFCSLPGSELVITITPRCFS